MQFKFIFHKQSSTKNVRYRLKEKFFGRCLHELQFKCIIHKQSETESRSKSEFGSESEQDRFRIHNTDFTLCLLMDWNCIRRGRTEACQSSSILLTSGTSSKRWQRTSSPQANWKSALHLAAGFEVYGTCCGTPSRSVRGIRSCCGRWSCPFRIILIMSIPFLGIGFSSAASMTTFLLTAARPGWKRGRCLFAKWCRRSVDRRIVDWRILCLWRSFSTRVSMSR